MVRPVTQGKPAEYHHTRVLFSPFGAEPGSALVLSADPWAFLQAYLKSKEAGSRGENRIRIRRANYYLSLAEEFYHSAESARLPAKATLAYYGVLNLAKCFISTRGKTLGDEIEHHGLSPSQEDQKDIRVTQRPRRSVSIFHEFVAALGSPLPTQANWSVSECIAHIPEVHEIAFRQKLLPDNRRHLLPVEIEILVDEEDKWLFSELVYWKKQEHRLRTDRVYSGRRKTYFREAREEDDGRIIHRCKRRKALTWSRFKRLFGNICSEYSGFDLAALLTKDGYRYYCDLGDPKYHHLAYSFMLLFHLGTISRYSPAETEVLLGGPLRPVIAETLSLTPQQVLYQLVSYITASVCVVPFSKL